MTEMRLIIGLLIVMMSISQKVKAQDSTRTAPSVTLSGYTDVYFATFSNDLEPNALQPFTTVSPRSDRFGLNVAQLSVAYAAERLRGTLTLHYGDIAEATWADPFRMIQEAQCGTKLAGRLVAGRRILYHAHRHRKLFAEKQLPELDDRGYLQRAVLPERWPGFRTKARRCFRLSCT